MSSSDDSNKEFEDPSILTDESPDQKILMAAIAAKKDSYREPPVLITLSEFKYEIERQ